MREELEWAVAFEGLHLLRACQSFRSSSSLIRYYGFLFYIIAMEYWTCNSRVDTLSFWALCRVNTIFVKNCRTLKFIFVFKFFCSSLRCIEYVVGHYYIL